MSVPLSYRSPNDRKSVLNSDKRPRRKQKNWLKGTFRTQNEHRAKSNSGLKYLNNYGVVSWEKNIQTLNPSHRDHCDNSNNNSPNNFSKWDCTSVCCSLFLTCLSIVSPQACFVVVCKNNVACTKYAVSAFSSKVCYLLFANFQANQFIICQTVRSRWISSLVPYSIVVPYLFHFICLL